MNVTDREARILGILQQTTNLSVSEISRATKLRSHVVRHIINSLLQREAIIPYTPVNTAALGFTEYHVVMGAFQSPAYANARDALARSPRVPFVVELDGELQFSVWARTQLELGALFDELRVNSDLGEKRALLVRRWYMGLGVCFDTSIERKGYLLAPLPVPASIDDVDHRILAALGSVSADTISALARVARLPASTVEYRLRRLKRVGVVLDQPTQSTRYGWAYLASSFEPRPMALPTHAGGSSTLPAAPRALLHLPRSSVRGTSNSAYACGRTRA